MISALKIQRNHAAQIARQARPTGPRPGWAGFGFGLDLRRGKVERRDGTEPVGVESAAERAPLGQTEAEGGRDERAFRRLERTEAGGVEGTPPVLEGDERRVGRGGENVAAVRSFTIIKRSSRELPWRLPAEAVP